MPFTFLHAADLHLDTPFRRVGGYPAAVADDLREASLQAWGALVDEAVATGVAFVLLAGDLYDGLERGVRAQFRVLEGLERLAAHGIRTFVVHGNHDPVEHGWTAVGTFPPEVTIFGADRVDSVTFEAGGEQVVVHGISYPRRDVRENLARRFPAAVGDGVNIGLLHANVAGISGHADYSPCTVADLADTGYGYWALGHVHQRQVVRAGAPWIVYPGNLQGRSPRATEQGAKGAVLVDVDEGRIHEPTFVALDRVRFATVSVGIDDTDVAGLLARLESAADPAAHDGRALIVAAQVTGTGPLHEDLLAPGRRADLLAELRDRGTARSPFVWWNELRWATRGTDDADPRGRGDFVSDLLATIERVGPDDRRAWVDLLPGEVRRLLAADLPDGLDPAISDRADRLAVEAVTGAAP